MALTKRQRKERLGRGGQKSVATAAGVAPSVVSAVMNNKVQLYAKETVQKVRTAIAERIGESVEEVFGQSAAA